MVKFTNNNTLAAESIGDVLISNINLFSLSYYFLFDNLLRNLSTKFISLPPSQLYRKIIPPF